MDDPSRPVQEIELISDIEEMTLVGPDTVALLTLGVARGTWMVSAALRYAWERRACAIIVPEQSFTQTVVELARRLRVSLLTSDQDMRRLAIRAATQIGAARAESLARVQQFSHRLSRETDVREVLRLTSDELEGARVAIETAGVVTLAHPPYDATEVSERLPGEGLSRVSAPIVSVDSDVDTLVTEVSPLTKRLAEQVLSATTPMLRALLADARLQATRDSLPIITLTTLSGDPASRNIHDPSEHLHLDELNWPVAGEYVAVCIIPGNPEQAGTAVHQFWNLEFGSIPLARLLDGWIGFAPMSEGTDWSEALTRIRERLDRLRRLGIKIGVSNTHASAAEARTSVREAWLAARSADSSGDDGTALVEFTHLTAHLLPRFFPREVARQIGELLLPDLLQDPACDELILAVRTYLDHRGSISGAAAELGVHRNTLQTRLRRAEELGVRLSDPNEVLPTHMLMTALLPVVSLG